MIKTETQYRSDIIEICKRIYSKGWVAANDGNVSIKINQDTVLCTPTGMSKGYLTTDQLIKVDMSGNKTEGELKPSSEVKMHIDVYKNRPEINSVVHAHPPYATGFAVAGIPLDKCVMPEIIISLGSIPLTRFGTPSTMEIPENVRPYLKEHNAFLLENHGALSVGEDVFQAYYRMESLELFAKISLFARMLGKENVISEENVKKLMQVREDFGLSNLNYPGCRIDDRFIRNGTRKDNYKTQDPVNIEQLKSSNKEDEVIESGENGKITITRDRLVELIATVVNNVVKNLK